jgi:hypothetical protein
MTIGGAGLFFNHLAGPSSLKIGTKAHQKAPNATFLLGSNCAGEKPGRLAPGPRSCELCRLRNRSTALAQIFTQTFSSGSAKVTGQVALLEQPEGDPPWIKLSLTDAHAGGLWKCMMIVVPAFSVREKTPAWEVGSLDPRSSDNPSPGTGIVRKVSHHPMARHTHRYPDEYSPDNPVSPTQRVKHNTQRNLMERPRGVHESIPGIVGELGFNNEPRRTSEPKRAVQLPKGIKPDSPTMREEIVTSSR